MVEMILLVVLAVASMVALLVQSCVLSRAVAGRDETIRELFEKSLTYRSVNSPEAQCVATLAETHRTMTEQSLAWTAEGREVLKERELAKTTIAAMEKQVGVYRDQLAAMGVRNRETTARPPMHQDNGTIAAFDREDIGG